MTNLHSVLKSRDMSLTTKVCIDKAMFFSVVVWMCVLDFKMLSTEELMLSNHGVGEDF